ncbi:MAG: hypothetical protein K9M98_09270 [Cephaloticoccus sp.]|nr:hypothetical protein [Cephaloticoccus sp.]MCF7760681.1 hypothetical protein [Cephaloticoccus sp.]
MPKKSVILLGLALATSLPATPPDANALMREAILAAQAGQFDTALARMQSAVVLRPNHPAYLYNLACVQSLGGHTDAALATLQSLADFGIYAPAAKDTDFAALTDRADFKTITAQFEQNLLPRGAAEEDFTLTEQMGLIEGIAFQPVTGEVFFGDMHLRCIWLRNGDGQVTRFSAVDERMLGVGGLVVDETREMLWAASSAQAVMSGWQEENANRGALIGFDLTTGVVRAYYPIPSDDRAHATVDLALAPDGTIYLSDSIAPVIWRLSPGATQLEKWIDDDRFRSLQGLTVSPDGNSLFVADYALGLFRIDLRSGAIAALATPTGNTLIGIDGLTRSGTQLIAVQNGVNPVRILAFDLDAKDELAAVHELAAALPVIADPTLGCVHDGRFHFIADAGWRFFSPGKTPTPDGRSVPIVSIALNP